MAVLRLCAKQFVFGTLASASFGAYLLLPCFIRTYVTPCRLPSWAMPCAVLTAPAGFWRRLPVAVKVQLLQGPLASPDGLAARHRVRGVKRLLHAAPSAVGSPHGRGAEQQTLQHSGALQQWWLALLHMPLCCLRCPPALHPSLPALHPLMPRRDRAMPCRALLCCAGNPGGSYQHVAGAPARRVHVRVRG